MMDGVRELLCLKADTAVDVDRQAAPAFARRNRVPAVHLHAGFRRLHGHDDSRFRSIQSSHGLPAVEHKVVVIPSGQTQLFALRM